MFWERPLEHALSNLKKRVNAPVRLVLWDGREVALSDEPRVTVRLKGTRAASAFMRPSLLALAEAYIDGNADLEGDLNEAIRGAEAISRSAPKPLFDAPSGPSRHTRREDREANGRVQGERRARGKRRTGAGPRRQRNRGIHLPGSGGEQGT